MSTSLLILFISYVCNSNKGAPESACPSRKNLRSETQLRRNRVLVFIFRYLVSRVIFVRKKTNSCFFAEAPLSISQDFKESSRQGCGGVLQGTQTPTHHPPAIRAGSSGKRRSLSQSNSHNFSILSESFWDSFSSEKTQPLTIALFALLRVYVWPLAACLDAKHPRVLKIGKNERLRKREITWQSTEYSYGIARECDTAIVVYRVACLIAWQF